MSAELKRALRQIIINSENLDEAVSAIDKFIMMNNMKSIYCAVCFSYEEFKNNSITRLKHDPDANELKTIASKVIQWGADRDEFKC